jgi:hypothetical protein
MVMEMRYTLKKAILIIGMVALLAVAVSAQVNGVNGNSNENYLVYDSNQGGIVEKSISLELEQGVQWVELENVENLDNVDPDSIKLEPENSDVLEVVDIKTDFRDDIKTNIGKEVEMELTSGKTISGVLLRIEDNYPYGLMVLENDEGISYINTKNVNQIKTTGDSDSKVMARIESSGSGSFDFQLRYRVNGITWDASYDLYMKDSDSSSRFSGDMIIKNPSNTNYDGNFNLISGQVMSSRYVGFAEERESIRDGFERSVSAPQKVGRVYKYELGQLAIDAYSRQSTKYLDKNIDSKTEFMYATSRYGRSENVRQFLTFTNNEEPLPKGTVNVYQEKDGLQVMVGQSSIERTPDGDEVEINLGSAFDLKGETEILEETRNAGNITRTGEINITNFGNSPETVTVRYMWEFGELLDSSVEPVETNADFVEWDIRVGANSDKTIEFEVAEDIRNNNVRAYSDTAEKEISPR